MIAFLALIQNSGNPFQFSWGQYAVWGTLLGVYLILVFTKKMPAMNSFKNFVDTVNSAGGHILLLAIFSIYFFKVAMQFFYNALNLPDEIITKRDAILMTGIAFVTGTAFGGAWGALLKTMTGAKADGMPTPPTAPPTIASVDPRDTIVESSSSNDSTGVSHP